MDYALYACVECKDGPCRLAQAPDARWPRRCHHHSLISPEHNPDWTYFGHVESEEESDKWLLEKGEPREIKLERVP
jgi:hypothetical protein